MPLDRQSVEKRDFPISRRGYEPEAVDAHLTQVAEELERIRRQAAGAQSSAAGPASIAAAASEQVRAIVEAAETSAAQIERAARDEADGIRRSAEAEAASTRTQAVQRSEEHVGKVGEATRLMLQRVDAMEHELQALVESLRTGANRLTADLSLLQGNMAELYDATGSPAPAQPVAPPVAPEPETAPEAEPAGHDTELRLVADEPAAEPEPEPVAAPEPAQVPAPPAAAPAAGSTGDAEGARLVALNMALNGQSRDETERYLAENFDLPDRKALLDEVYATVDG